MVKERIRVAVFDVLLLSGVLICLSGLASAQSIPRPELPPPPPPNCPLYKIGVVNGSYYYGTHNCGALIGFGQSNRNFETLPVPCVGYVCEDPISLAPGTRNATEDEIREEAQRYLRHSTHLSDGDGRKLKLERILPYLQRAVQILDSGNEQQKLKLLGEYHATMRPFRTLIELVQIPPGCNGLIGAFARDEKLKGDAKVVDQTTFEVSNDSKGVDRAKVVEDKIVAVRNASGDRVFFKVFTLRLKSGEVCRVGIEVLPDGIAEFRDVVFAERGTYAHRLFLGTTAGKADCVVVNSFQNLEP